LENQQNNKPNVKLMKAAKLITLFTARHAMKRALSLGVAACLSSTALAHDEDHVRQFNPLYIKGYQVYTNVAFMDPSHPIILQVRTGGEGGLSHLGKMRSWSTDQEGNLVTGELTAHYTFQDKDGHNLLLLADGFSTFQSDGRIIFAGSFTVLGGTGRFKRATGILHFEGWARATDPATGQGIGFVTVEGVLENTRIDAAPPLVSLESGIGTISNNEDFIYEGNGIANGLGQFKDHSQSRPGPFHSAFVGIIDGRFVFSSVYDAVWTDRHGDKLKFSAVEFLSYGLVMVNGEPAPDFSKPSTLEAYYTVESGAGAFKHAQGVLFGKGSLTPTSLTTVAAEIRGVGFLSNEARD
jgi:hypothetical protein